MTTETKENKCCPLKFNTKPLDLGCEKELCAWWNEDYGECCMWVKAFCDTWKIRIYAP